MTSPGPRRGLATVLPASVLTLVLGAVASGCASADPPVSPPAGVDGLVVPTPSPDPADFASRVDNPWLPLTPGSVREYDVSGQVPGTRTVTVVDGTSEVAGVATTGVRTVVAADDGTVVEEWVDHLAQDRAGNVWSFGHERTVPDTTGSWLAGTGGAQAGLAMPAVPRLGDGFRVELAPGVAEDVARVETLDAARSVPAGDFEDLVHVVVTDALDGTEVDLFYARDVGLVQEYTADSSVSLTEESAS